MSEFFRIIGVALLSLVCYLIIKPIKPDMAVFISISGSIIIVIMCIDIIIDVIGGLTDFVNKIGVDSQIFAVILKIVGVGYLTEFSSSLCCDAGNTLLADKIVLAGKVFILFLSFPIVTALLNMIVGLLP